MTINREHLNEVNNEVQKM